MNTKDYKKKMENELVKTFIDNFYEKVGYYPTVIIDRNVKTSDDKVLTLSKLETYFERHLPTIYEKKIMLSAKNRSRPLPELRFIFFFIARSMKYNLIEIGKYLGKRDHTTVIHGINTFRNLYETDERFKNKYYDIINDIKQDYESPIMDKLDKTENQPQSNLFFGLLQRKNPAIQ